MSEDGELSASQVEQIGRLLIPAVKEALRHEFHALRNELTGAITKQSAADNERMDGLESRVASLESAKAKALIGWAFIVWLATWAFQYAKAKLGL